MSEWTERIAHAASPVAVGEALADACAERFPFAIFSYAVFEPGVAAEPRLVLRSSEFSPAWLQPRFAPMVIAMERELPGALRALLAEPRAFDVVKQPRYASIERTALWNEHFRPVLVGQQLCVSLHLSSGPVGYFALTRTPRDVRFDEHALRGLDALRVVAQRALLGLTSLGGGDLAGTLDALTASFPHPAYLFGADGRLRWTSDEGVVRLGVASARVGSARILQGNPALDALTAAARGLLSDGERSPEPRLRRDGFLRPGERLAVRRFGGGGTPLLLLAVVPALAHVPGAPAHASEAEGRLPGLGATESRVARLAASGYTVLNISAHLGVTEATVRTHLRRVYVKLGVHGRAELASALLQGPSRG